MRRLLLVLALLCVALPARAQNDPDDDSLPPPPDYDGESTDWNGLSRLVATAHGLNLQVDVSNELRWNELDSGDILFILYPVNKLDPSRLTAFIRGGGRVLVADDYGDSAEAFGRLGAFREQPAGVDAVRFEADRAFAPVARVADKDHPLAEGVAELITNHPAIFRKVTGADTIFRFGGDEAVVVAGARGNGRFVAVSDPSVFINRMLEYEGNLRFAINALRWLGRPGVTDTLVIVSSEFAASGEPTDVVDDGSVRGRVGAMMDDFDSWLEERNDYLLTRGGLVALSVLVAMGLAALAALAVPGRRRTDLDGAWTRATPAGRPTGDFETLVAHFDAKGKRASYLYPAAVLRDHVNHRLEHLLGRPEPLFTFSDDNLRYELSHKAGPAALAAFDRVQRRLKALPTRMQAASPWSVGYLSAREFELLCQDVTDLESTLPPRKG
jgi:hypothetical protein